MKVDKFLGRFADLNYNNRHLHINPRMFMATDATLLLITELGLLEHGGMDSDTFSIGPLVIANRPSSSFAAQLMRLQPRVPLIFEDWELTWMPGRPSTYIVRAGGTTVIYVDGTPTEEIGLSEDVTASEALVHGGSGKWLSVSSGYSRGFDALDHLNRLKGFAILEKCTYGTVWVSKMDDVLGDNLRDVEFDVGSEHLLLDAHKYCGASTIRFALYANGAIDLDQRRFFPEFCKIGTLRDANTSLDQLSSAKRLFGQFIPSGNLADLALQWDIRVQLTLSGNKDEIFVRSMSSRNTFEVTEGPCDKANVFIRCSPMVLQSVSEHREGLLGMFRAGKITTWTKLWRIGIDQGVETPSRVAHCCAPSSALPMYARDAAWHFLRELTH